jgi:16S rRNA processing protein RimM
MARLIEVGRILRPHGVRGEVVVERYGESVDLLEPGVTLFGRKGALTMDLTVGAARPHKKDWIVVFEGVASRTEAEALGGTTLLVGADRLPPLPEGTYYNFQLEGLAVRTTEGEALGRIEEILETGANPVLVVRGAGGEFLIPSVGQVVRDVDLKAGTMTVELIPGLVPERDPDGPGTNEGEPEP